MQEKKYCFAKKAVPFIRSSFFTVYYTINSCHLLSSIIQLIVIKKYYYNYNTLITRY